MTKPRLIYFDFSGSRGEECRIALHLAGVDFDDVRIKSADWPAFKPTTPFGSMPILELPGRPLLAQSNAILAYIGRLYDLHPSDPFEAARHEALMCHIEDLRHAISPSMRVADEDQKKVAREILVRDVIPAWGANAEKQLGAGPFVGGSKLNVVDIKFYIVLRWLRSGVIDHVPPTLLDDLPKLIALHSAVAEYPRVKDWLSRTAAS